MLTALLAGATVGCLADASLESAGADLQPLAGAYAVRVRSVVEVNHLDENGVVIGGPYEKPFETRGVLFLDPQPNLSLDAPSYAGRFRLCAMTLPGSGQGYRIVEDPYPHLPEYPLALEPDASGWTIAPWAMVIGAELASPITDPIDFGSKDKRTRPLADGDPGLTISVSVPVLGNVELDMVVRAVLRDGRVWNAPDGSGGLEGNFGQVAHTLWALSADGWAFFNPTQKMANDDIQARQRPWPIVGEHHVVRGRPLPFPNRAAVDVCAAAANAYP